MPFIQRFVEPVNVSRTCLKNDNNQIISLPNYHELEAVVNNTLSNELRQLASLLLIADSIFHDLGEQLRRVCERSIILKSKVSKIQKKVDLFHFKNISVSKRDLCSFASRKEHYESQNQLDTCIFNAKSRPKTVQDLYNAATKNPINIIRQLDDFRKDGARSSKFFQCIPVFEKKRKKIENFENIDIETRIPAALKSLRKWTSSEVLGDLTVNINHPNQVISCTNSSNCDIDSSLHTNFNDANLTFSRNGFISENDKIEVQNDNGVCHKLPSPEEQVQIIANKYSSKIIPIDVSGKLFNRLSQQRKSLVLYEVEESKKRSKSRHRKVRSFQRRNTLAGTDQKELHEILNAHSSLRNEQQSTKYKTDENVIIRSKSSDQLRSGIKAILSFSEENGNKKQSHFAAIKQWSRNTIRKLNKNNNPINKNNKHDNEDLLDYNKKFDDNVKLRESFSVQRRLNRLGIISNFKDEIHSSSGNWSASSESGRASVVSESIPRPKSSSSNNSSAANYSLVPNRRKFGGVLTPTTSEDTVIPDIQDLDGGETSSVYSCDAEGYYTSFHLDSGLKPLKEEDTSNIPIVPSVSSTAFVTINALSSDNDYDIFGKGSTSTTTSSAGTVCTTLLKRSSNSPHVPERKSSLKSLDKKSGSDSPDSGHNTSSSPIESIHSPNGMRSGSEFDYSETSSEFDASEGVERIRVRTCINSNNIPAMCVITPPLSDEERVREVKFETIDNIDNIDNIDINNINCDLLFLERNKRQGARVVLDLNGKVVYSSDSLDRKHNLSTVFESGFHVKSKSMSSPVIQKPIQIIRPINSIVQKTKKSPEIVNNKIYDNLPTITTSSLTIEDRQQNEEEKVFSLSNFNSISPILSNSISNKIKTSIKHSTPKLNLISLNKKSSMTNEQLYTLIHQSKRKMNIQTDDYDNNNNNTNLSNPEINKSKNANLDFKKLLLEQNNRQSPLWLKNQKLTAVEQLKHSKNSNLTISNQSLPILDPMFIQNLTSSPKYRNCNRKLIQNINIKKKFPNQRYDILSTSIPEVYCEDDNHLDNNDTNELCEPRPTLETAL